MKQEGTTSGIVGNIHYVNKILKGRAESVNVEITDNKGGRLRIWPGQTVVHHLQDIAFPGDRKYHKRPV